jgi:hypothetical protein
VPTVRRRPLGRRRRFADWREFFGHRMGWHDSSRPGTVRQEEWFRGNTCAVPRTATDLVFTRRSGTARHSVAQADQLASGHSSRRRMLSSDSDPLRGRYRAPTFESPATSRQLTWLSVEADGFTWWRSRHFLKAPVRMRFGRSRRRAELLRRYLLVVTAPLPIRR